MKLLHDFGKEKKPLATKVTLYKVTTERVLQKKNYPFFSLPFESDIDALRKSLDH